MDAYYRGKIEVALNNNFVGYASSFGVTRNAETGAQKINLTVEKSLNKLNKIISKEENYDAFFQKFFKAFSNKE